MVPVPEVKFTRSGNVDLAYQVFGEGPLDILLMIGWVSHLEVLWELPECRRFLERYASMGRVALFDKRGTGLSDRPTSEATTDEMVPDVLAVMDAVGMEQAALVGWTDAAAIAMTVAAMHQERVSALVLGEVLATTTPDEDHPWGPDPEAFETVARVIEQGMWGQAILLPLIAPSVSEDQRIVSWFRKLERMSATPSMAAGLLRRMMEIDLRPLLSSVAAPTLLLHRKDAPFIPAEGMRWLAEHLPKGQYVEVPGDETPGYLGDVDGLMDEIEEFLIGTRVGGAIDRQVATVLFSDVVGSTERAAGVGDRVWSGLLESHRAEARRLLTRYGGKEMHTAGDGFLMVFASPTPAIECALAMSQASRSTGLDIRVGLHSGEVVFEADDISGMAVHIGARVAALANPGEVVVSQTVRDMVIGSRFALTPRGRHELKGVPGTWEIFVVGP
jgi:class 3 adenylate cyclase/pimeloyl-ACP methyl ester carboxylesterase